MGRLGKTRGFAAVCVLIFSISSCGSAGPSSQREESEEPPLPSVEPSVEATRGAEIVDRSECPETTLLPTDSTEPIAPSSCGTRSVSLTEEQMRQATPAPMPLHPSALPEGNSADSQIKLFEEGEQRLWTPERMRSASPEPMPRVP